MALLYHLVLVTRYSSIKRDTVLRHCDTESHFTVASDTWCFGGKREGKHVLFSFNNTVSHGTT